MVAGLIAILMDLLCWLNKLAIFEDNKMAAYKQIEVNDGTDNCVRRYALIEVRRYQRNRPGGHITVTLESGWPMDRPVLVKRTNNKNGAKKLVREFLAGAYANFYKRAEVLGV